MVVENQSMDVVSNTSSDEVEVILTYEGNVIKFPINPENLKEVIDSNSTTENIEGIGEISIPQRPSLSTISFSSFFWADRDDINPREYVKWIKTWQKSKKPARLSVSSIDWDLNVTCESFSYWVNAGEEKDIYFTLTLMEYRTYGAKKVRLVGNQYVLDENGIQTVVGTTTLYGDSAPNSVPLFEQASPREAINKRKAPISVMVGEDESIVSVTSRYSPNGTKDWKALYNENKGELAEAVTNTIEGGRLASEFRDTTAVVKTAITQPQTFLKIILNILHPNI